MHQAFDKNPIPNFNALEITCPLLNWRQVGGFFYQNTKLNSHEKIPHWDSSQCQHHVPFE
jgi:hypothetical protein